MITYNENLKTKIVLPAQAVTGVQSKAEIISLPENQDISIDYSDLITSDDGYKNSYSAYINVPLSVKLLAEDENFCDSANVIITIQQIITQSQTKDADTSVLIDNVKSTAIQQAELLVLKIRKLAQITKYITLVPRYVGKDKRTEDNVISCYLSDITDL